MELYSIALYYYPMEFDNVPVLAVHTRIRTDIMLCSEEFSAKLYPPGGNSKVCNYHGILL